MQDSKQISQRVGARIRQLRTQRGLSQERLALECEMNVVYLGQVERGERCPTVFTLYRICLGLGIELSELFSLDFEELPNNNALDIHHVTAAMESMTPEQAHSIAKIVDEVVQFPSAPSNPRKKQKR
jgi:transcriptional regulator with XRE-family HTH domain